MTDNPLLVPVPGAMSRWRAAGIHLLISLAIAAVAMFVLLRVWYPPPFFVAEGGSDLLFLLVAVDVVIGPLITLIVFRVGKPSLRFDLTVIAVLQACALAYGCHVMFLARPVYVALVVDQFETVRANDLDPADVAQAKEPAFRSLPLTGPVFVSVDIPKDLKEIKAILAEAQTSGKLVTHQPRYYAPYARMAAQAVNQGQSLEDAIKRSGDFAAMAKQYLSESGRQAASLRYIPMQTRRGFGAVLIDAKSGEIVTVIPPKL